MNILECMQSEKSDWQRRSNSTFHFDFFIRICGWNLCQQHLVHLNIGLRSKKMPFKHCIFSKFFNENSTLVIVFSRALIEWYFLEKTIETKKNFMNILKCQENSFRKKRFPRWNLTQMADTDGSESTFETKPATFFYSNAPSSAES